MVNILLHPTWLLLGRSKANSITQMTSPDITVKKIVKFVAGQYYVTYNGSISVTLSTNSLKLHGLSRWHIFRNNPVFFTQSEPKVTLDLRLLVRFTNKTYTF